MVFGEIIFRVCDLILFKQSVLMFADEIVRDMTLEFLFRAFEHNFTALEVGGLTLIRKTPYSEVFFLRDIAFRLISSILSSSSNS